MKQKLSTMRAGTFAGFFIVKVFLGGGVPPVAEREASMIIGKMESYDQIYRDVIDGSINDRCLILSSILFAEHIIIMIIVTFDSFNYLVYRIHNN